MVRKILLGLLALSFFSVAQAQMALDKEGEVVVTLLPSDFDASLTVYITNESNSEDCSVAVQREEISTVLGTSNYFCFGVNCYPASTDASTNSQQIGPGGMDSTFKAYYEPKGNEGNSEIRYCFTDENDANAEPICLTITFAAAEQTSIQEMDREVNLTAFYSAEKEAITLGYANLTGNGSVEIRDITGKVVQSTAVQLGNGVVLVPAGNLSNGIHIVSLKDANENVVAVQKLSVY